MYALLYLIFILFFMFWSIAQGIKALTLDEKAPLAKVLKLKKPQTENRYYYKYEAPPGDGKWTRRFRMCATMLWRFALLFLLGVLIKALRQWTLSDIVQFLFSFRHVTAAGGIFIIFIFFLAVLSFAFVIAMATGIFYIPLLAVYIRRKEKDICIHENLATRYRRRFTFPLSEVKNVSPALHNAKELFLLHEQGFYRWAIQDRGPTRPKEDVFYGIVLELRNGRRAFIHLDDAENFIAAYQRADGSRDAQYEARENP